MNEKFLDNLNGQELSELIENKSVKAEELDAEALSKVFDYQTKLLCLGLGDFEILYQCAELLENANGKPLLTEDEFIGVIKKAEKEQVQVTKRKKFVLRKRAIIAIAAAALVVIGTIIATGIDADSTETINNEITWRQLANIPIGTEIDFGNYTYKHIKMLASYETVEEFLENEDCGVLIPTKLPEDTNLESVDVLWMDENEKQIFFRSETTDMYISIATNRETPEEYSNYQNYDAYDANGKIFYINRDESHALAYHGGCRYFIRTKNYEDLHIILDNMTEINK